MTELSPTQSYDMVRSNPTLQNKQIFIHLHENYFGQVVFATLRNKFKQRADIDEMTSRVKLRLLRYAYSMDFSRSYKELLGYMTLCAVRTCTAQSNHQKQKDNECFFKEQWQWDVIKQPQRKLTAAEEKVAEVREHANADELAVIDRYQQGARSREIAKELGISESGVNVKLKRMGRRLRKLRIFQNDN